MDKKYVYILSILIIILGIGCVTPDNAPKGDYTTLDKPSDYEPGKVKIMEFMKFDCPHCYDLYKKMPQIQQKYGDNVEIKYIPVTFSTSTKSIEAYIIADQMGKGKEMMSALFDAKFNKNMDIMESTIEIEKVAAEIGLKEDFNQKLESGGAKGEASKNINLMKEYTIDETPTVIVNGNLKVKVDITNIDEVVGSILGKG